MLKNPQGSPRPATFPVRPAPRPGGVKGASASATTYRSRMLDADALADIEGDCAAIHALAGVDPAKPFSVRTLAVRLMGRPPRFARILREATIGTWAGGPQICIRHGTPGPRARWLTGHELAEWWYSRIGYRGEDREARCDALGAALVVPRVAFVRARRSHGDDPIALAEALKTTQSLALLRLGECIGTPVVLDRPAGPIVRGAEYAWPPLPELRRELAREPRPGLRKVRITDEPRRTGVIGEVA